MSKGAPPDSSGLPRLPTPRYMPATAVQSSILAVVLYVTSQRRDGHVSRREQQQLLGRASRSGIDDAIRKLEQQRFLESPIRNGQRRRPPQAALSYVPGRKLRGKTGDDWQTLALTLYGKNGICKGLLGRWAFGPRFLGLNGMLVLGALRASQRGLKVSELHSYLGSFISHEQTVRNRLKLALEHGLVVKDGPVWSTSSDFKARLKAYEDTKGPTLSRHRVRTQHAIERQAFGITLRGGSIRPRDEVLLRRKGCIRCGKTNHQHRKENDGAELEMEHFPPRAWLKQWGINDHLDLNWAICAAENNHYGKFVKRVKIPALDKFIGIALRQTEDSDRIVIAKLETSIHQFYKAIDDGNDEKAAQIAARAFVLWHGLVQAPNELRVTYLAELRERLSEPVARPLERPAGRPARLRVSQWAEEHNVARPRTRGISGKSVPGAAKK
jgi:hypothetical protein